MNEKRRRSATGPDIEFERGQREQKAVCMIGMIVFRRMNDQQGRLNLPDQFREFRDQLAPRPLCQRRKLPIRIAEKMQSAPNKLRASTRLRDAHSSGSLRHPSINASLSISQQNLIIRLTPPRLRCHAQIGSIEKIRTISRVRGNLHHRPARIESRRRIHILSLVSIARWRRSPHNICASVPPEYVRKESAFIVLKMFPRYFLLLS